MQVLDTNLLRDTCIMYVRNFRDDKVVYVAAPATSACFSIQVYDGFNTLYVTVKEDSLNMLNLTAANALTNTQFARHPLVGAEILISLRAEDVYGVLCKDAKLRESVEQDAEYTIVYPKDIYPRHHQIIHLHALDVEFVRYGLPPSHNPTDAMGATFSVSQVFV